MLREQEVLIRVRAIGINPVETYIRRLANEMDLLS